MENKKERGLSSALSMIIGIFFLHSIFYRLQYICVYALPGLGGGLPLEQAKGHVVLAPPGGRAQLLPQQVNNVRYPHEVRLAGLPRLVGRKRI